MDAPSKSAPPSPLGDGVGRLFPLGATAILGVAQALAWRTSAPVLVWFFLGGVYFVLAMIAARILARDEVLGENLALLAGDVSRGIGGAALTIGICLAVGTLAIKVAPQFTVRELGKLLQVRAAVHPEWKRALLAMGFAFTEELVFRAAATHVLEERFGSRRAPWVASGLYVISTLPSLRAGLIFASVVFGAVAAFFVSRYRRPVIAMIAHAVFTWVAMEIVLVWLWEKLRVAGVPLG